MASLCVKEDCFPNETGCNHEGHHVLSECPHYKINSFDGNPNAVDTKEDLYIRMPWTGNTLGVQDLNFLASSSKVLLVGVTGVASAGKTTFLASLYCLLRAGLKIGNYQYAGSLTLIGWENIAWYLSWKQNNHIRFPLHTTSNAGRIPGLLHISLRGEDGQRKEIIFTDAPGEWFNNWIANKQASNAQGAEWIHQNADAFLLFADSELLASSHLGKARQQTRLVSDRLKHGLADRPLGLIWSKSDIPLDAEIKAQINGYITNSKIKYYKEFETSVRNDDRKLQMNILESINWILTILTEQQNENILISRHQPTDLFLSKRHT